jgi:prepilin-type N-terminal cleavage/methylation domain-containing protein
MTMSRGFTLIELLVVIVVLGILAGLLVPAIGQVRQSALRSNCISHLRQVAMTAFSYANDWEDQLPADRIIKTKETAATSPAWFHRLPEYLDLADTGPDRTVFHCPVWRLPPTAVKPLAANYPRSYKQNDYLDFDAGTGTYQYNQATPTNRHLRLSAVPDHAELLLFADGDLGQDGTTGPGQWGRLQESLVFFDRHRGRAVGVMLDGHTALAQEPIGFTWVSRVWPAP